MYLTTLKTALVEALRNTFDDDYPQPDFRRLKVSIEYPMEQTAYPGLWVTYEDNDPLTVAGIAHREYIETDPNVFQEVVRWRFGGTITVTCVALTSLQRDRLYDEMVRTFAFGRVNGSLSAFRDTVEQNDLVALNINFDDLKPSGESASMGTPWETDEIIYEKSLSMDCIGEFVGDPGSNSLVPISSVKFIAYPEGTHPQPWPSENPDGEIGESPSVIAGWM